MVEAWKFFLTLTDPLLLSNSTKTSCYSKEVIGQWVWILLTSPDNKGKVAYTQPLKTLLRRESLNSIVKPLKPP